MKNAFHIAFTLCTAVAPSAAYAQARGPAAQYWIDLSTSNLWMPGMP